MAARLTGGRARAGRRHPGARLVAVLLMNASALMASAQSSQFVGIVSGDAALGQGREGNRGLVAFSNDCFGPGPVSEWDDLDSYALALSLPLGPGLELGASYSGITDRGASADEGSRTDRMAAFLAWQGHPLYLGPVAVVPGCGGGLIALGDFGGMAIQEGWHSGNGILRPVPGTYDAGRLAALGGLELGFIDAEGRGPEAGIALDADSAADWVARAFLGYTARRGDSLLSARATWAEAGSHSSPDAFGTLLERERGLMVSAHASIGLLSAGIAAWPFADLTNGWIGLNFRARRDDSPGQPSASPRLCVGFDLSGAASQYFRLEVALHDIAPMASLGAFAGFGNGWMLREASGSAAPRNSDYSIGPFIRFGRKEGGSAVAVEAGLGPVLRLSFQDLRSLGAERSGILGERKLLLLDLEADARLRLELADLPPFGLGLGFRWTAVSAILSEGGEGFAEAPAIALRIFAYSGD